MDAKTMAVSGAAASSDKKAPDLWALKNHETIRCSEPAPFNGASGLRIEMEQFGPADAGRGASKVVQFALKRVFDLVGAGLAIICLLPLAGFVAVAIKMEDGGPVFFGQRREGLNGRLFTAFKFRTMSVKSCDLSGVSQTKEDDPRVTSIGRLLRRTSIDELPQLLNVVLGDMSIVGPRPHVPHMLAGGVEYRSLVPYYDYRLRIRPGITGWAQANGLRGSTTNEVVAKARIDHDVAYIQNFSIALDALTILKTLRNEFVTGNAQ